jgi:hypothetical protein
MKGVTLAWLGNYTSLIDTVLKQVVRRRDVARTPVLMFLRPIKFLKTCYRMRVTMIRCPTCSPSDQLTKEAHTRA